MNRPGLKPAVAFVFFLLAGNPAFSQLVIEPVINRFPAGEEGIPVGSILPTPGSVFAYVSGDPRDPKLDTFPARNNSPFLMNGYGLEIIGSGTDTHDPSTIVREPIDAVFGDVDGDGKILSDIFDTYQLSSDGKRIEFSGGEIQMGERFTAIHLASSSRQSDSDPPVYAGIESWYTAAEPTGVTTVSFQKILTSGADPFDPEAIWTGKGKTFGGDDVEVRAYGLVTEPAGDVVNITDFTFDVTGSGIDESFTLTGTYTPTDELSGDIELHGQRASLLMASSKDGLITTGGTIRFNAVPEPSAHWMVWLGLIGVALRQRKSVARRLALAA